MNLGICKREKKKEYEKSTRGRSCFAFNISSQKLSTCASYQLGFQKPFAWNFEGVKGMLLLVHRTGKFNSAVSPIAASFPPPAVCLICPVVSGSQKYWET